MCEKGWMITRGGRERGRQCSEAWSSSVWSDSQCSSNGVQRQSVDKIKYENQRAWTRKNIEGCGRDENRDAVSGGGNQC